MANPLIGGPEPNGSDIAIDAGDAQLAAYESRPASGGSAPAVIVIHENRGLVPYLRDVADGLASNGYIAVAPDLLSRDGGTASIEDIPAKLGEIPRERHVSDVQAVIAYLKAQSDVTRIGIIGFCFGGGITWRVATESEEIAAAVPFYGANPPLEQVPNIKGAVYAVYGELDERINAGIDDITKALNDAGATCDMKVYANAPHAFHNHTNAERYNQEAAEAAWADALAWFGKHLAG